MTRLRPIFFVFVLAILYLVWGTGIHSDDYILISQASNKGVLDYLLPNPETLHVLVFQPFSYYFDFFSYYIFGYDFIIGYDWIKWLTSLLSVWLTYYFFRDYCPSQRALFAAAVFVFYPTHDATIFWVLTLTYTLTPAMLMYSHHLIRQGRLIGGFSAGMVGALTSFGSPPYTFGLGLIFLYERAYRKAALFLSPGILFVLYYFLVSRVPGLAKGRVNSDLAIATFLKRFVLQIGTYMDVLVGPSFWLKLWYSAQAISLLSLLMCVAIVTLIWKLHKQEPLTRSRSLLIGGVGVLILALAMYALTGLYPQTAFNLGNRVVVHGTLLVAVLFAMIPLSRTRLTLISAVLLIPLFGLSDHWKEWNTIQNKVIENIRTNPELAKLTKNDVVLVTGHSYSQLGPFNHIEFLSEGGMATPIFVSALRQPPPYRLVAINRRFDLAEGRLIDRKYGDQPGLQLGNEVFIYDAESNLLERIPTNQLPTFLGNLRPETRHWVQLLKEGWLRRIVLTLMPRLKYLFDV